MKDQVNITTQFFELVDDQWMQKLHDDDTLDSETNDLDKHWSGTSLKIEDCLKRSTSTQSEGANDIYNQFFGGVSPENHD